MSSDSAARQLQIEAESQAKWDLRFLRLAAEVSTWSKDPSTKLAAVIVDPGRHVVSTGYNGFAKGVHDAQALYDDRETKYPRTIHGEMNAILRARCDLAEHTIYVWPMMPCHVCASPIIQSGIKRVVSIAFDEGLAKRWEESASLAAQFFKEAGVSLELYARDVVFADFNARPRGY